MARSLDEWVAVQCLAESLAGTSPGYLRLENMPPLPKTPFRL